MEVLREVIGKWKLAAIKGRLVVLVWLGIAFLCLSTVSKARVNSQSNNQDIVHSMPLQSVVFCLFGSYLGSPITYVRSHLIHVRLVYKLSFGISIIQKCPNHCA